MVSTRKHDLDDANGHTGRFLDARLQRALSKNPARAAELAGLQREMERFRHGTDVAVDPETLDRLLDRAERRADRPARRNGLAPVLAGGALVAVISLGLWMGPDSTTVVPGDVDVSESTRTRISLIRADGAIRIYLTLPQRTHREVAAS